MRGTVAEELVVVMTARESGLERRSSIIQHGRAVNQQWDELRDACKRRRLRARRMDVGSRMRRESHVRFWEGLG
jgi:hypothetical protein